MKDANALIENAKSLVGRLSMIDSKKATTTTFATTTTQTVTTTTSAVTAEPDKSFWDIIPEELNEWILLNVPAMIILLVILALVLFIWNTYLCFRKKAVGSQDFFKGIL